MKTIAFLVAVALPLSIPMLSFEGDTATGPTSSAGQDPVKQAPGYDDGPMLPGQQWRVHDRRRPQPPKVTAADEAGGPPSDAVVLFDGTDLSSWLRSDGKAASWRLEGDAMVVNGTGGIRTRELFGDCQLHIEWATPESAAGSSQGMGNSGVFLMGLYEIQVLDSHSNVSYADGSAGALYGQYPPDVNVSRPPGQWQVYDILFTAPRFDEEGRRTSAARITVLHNGVLIHNDREILGPTTHRALPPVGDYPGKRPLSLQDHGSAVRYRNIWIRPLE
jgi:hypothetical protein